MSEEIRNIWKKFVFEHGLSWDAAKAAIGPMREKLNQQYGIFGTGNRASRKHLTKELDQFTMIQFNHAVKRKPDLRNYQPPPQNHLLRSLCSGGLCNYCKYIVPNSTMSHVKSGHPMNAKENYNTQFPQDDASMKSNTHMSVDLFSFWSTGKQKEQDDASMKSNTHMSVEQVSLRSMGKQQEQDDASMKSNTHMSVEQVSLRSMGKQQEQDDASMKSNTHNMNVAFRIGKQDGNVFARTVGAVAGRQQQVGVAGTNPFTSTSISRQHHSTQGSNGGKKKRGRFQGIAPTQPTTQLIDTVTSNPSHVFGEDEVEFLLSNHSFIDEDSCRISTISAEADLKGKSVQELTQYFNQAAILQRILQYRAAKNRAWADVQENLAKEAEEKAVAAAKKCEMVKSALVLAEESRLVSDFGGLRLSSPQATSAGTPTHIQYPSNDNFDNDNISVISGITDANSTLMRSDDRGQIRSGILPPLEEEASGEGEDQQDKIVVEDASDDDFEDLR
jgi:hypothetical protein